MGKMPVEYTVSNLDESKMKKMPGGIFNEIAFRISYITFLENKGVSKISKTELEPKKVSAQTKK